MPAVVDSHAHCTSKEFDRDRDEMLRRAFDAGVQFVVNPGTDLEDSRRAVELADQYGQVSACVGIHPHEARSADDEALKEIEELSRHGRVVAIGEIGLDFHTDAVPREVQERVFLAQLEIAARRDLPVVLHTRDALLRTIELVEEFSARAPAWRSGKLSPLSRTSLPKGVFHCFSGSIAEAWRVIRAGFFISFGGVITFKNAASTREVASGISLEHLLLETDSPYLAPEPLRGKRNEVLHVLRVAEKLAELQSLSLNDVARTTNYGAYTLFGLGEAPSPRIVYELRNSLYINLTIRCNADCVFCDRKGDAIIKGHSLRIESEPTSEEVLKAIGDPKRYEEIVFCGYGEPTIRLDVLKEVARSVKALGGKTRLNTDGHGNIINKRNIVPELIGLIDAVSISLNSTDPRQYGELMRIDGERYFAAMIDFAKLCVQALPRVIMTAVDLDAVDMARARRLVEEEIGARFQLRPYF
jgi:TatD DNase family protein